MVVTSGDPGAKANRLNPRARFAHPTPPGGYFWRGSARAGHLGRRPSQSSTETLGRRHRAIL